MVNFMEAGMSTIFDDPTSIFSYVKAREILYEGIEIDCSKKGFPSKTICSFLQKDKHMTVVEGNLKYNFAILNDVRLRIFEV